MPRGITSTEFGVQEFMLRSGQLRKQRFNMVNSFECSLKAKTQLLLDKDASEPGQLRICRKMIPSCARRIHCLDRTQPPKKLQSPTCGTQADVKATDDLVPCQWPGRDERNSRISPIDLYNRAILRELTNISTASERR
jgi:hypothetical protein